MDCLVDAAFTRVCGGAGAGEGKQRIRRHEVGQGIVVL